MAVVGKVLAAVLFLCSRSVSCISLLYATGGVVQRFSGFVSSLVSCISLLYATGGVVQRFSGFVSSVL